jgi:hypothetical protein
VDPIVLASNEFLKHIVLIRSWSLISNFFTYGISLRVMLTSAPGVLVKDTKNVTFVLKTTFFVFYKY